MNRTRSIRMYYDAGLQICPRFMSGHVVPGFARIASCSTLDLRVARTWDNFGQRRSDVGLVQADSVNNRLAFFRRYVANEFGIGLLPIRQTL